MAIVGRLQLDHPPLGEPGGAPLHADIESIYTKISDNISGRYFVFTAVPDGDPITCLHNLGVNLNQLEVFIYSGTYSSFTVIDDPTNLTVPWAIAETGGSSTTSLTITAPASGGPFTGAIFIVHAKGAEVKASRVNRSITASATASNKRIHLIDSTGGAINLTLPAPSTNLFIEVKEVAGMANTNAVILVRPGGQEIDGVAANFQIYNYESFTIVSDGTDYFLI